MVHDGFDFDVTGVYFNSGGGNDIIEGSSFNDFLRGGRGDDFVDGGEGDDLIRGGSGSDQIMSGTGADIIYYTIDQIDNSFDSILDLSSKDKILLASGIDIASIASDELIISADINGIEKFVTIATSGLDQLQVISI